MAEASRELDYISNVIAGTAPQGQDPAQGNRRARKAKKIPTGSSGQRANRLPAPGAREGDPGAGCSKNQNQGPTPSVATPPDPYSQPSNKSTAKVLHCAACDVWVPRRDGDWQVHIAGIRHRRQTLSLREHGQRGKLVISAFESDPHSEDNVHRVAGKAASEFGLTRKSTRHQQQRAQQDPELRSMRTTAMAQILNVYGKGRVYNSAANLFSEDILQLARAQVNTLLLARGAPAVEQAAEIFQTPAAMVACAVALKTLPKGPESEHQLPVLLIIRMPLADSAGEVAAWMCAADLLLSELAEHPSEVSTLAFSLPMDTPDHLREILHQGLPRLLTALGNILAKNTKLESLKLFLGGAISPDIIVNSDSTDSEEESEEEDEFEVDFQLSDAIRAIIWPLKETARDTAHAVRLTVLMSQHRRVGRCSVLQLLPPPAIAEIVKLAAPKNGCRITLTRGDVPERDPERWWELED